MSWLLVLALPIVALIAQDLWTERQHRRRHGGLIDLTGCKPRERDDG